MNNFSTMMNHFLRDGFNGSFDNRISGTVKMTDDLEIEKIEGGWSVRVIRDFKEFGSVVISVEEMMFWLYRRTF